MVGEIVRNHASGYQAATFVPMQDCTVDLDFTNAGSGITGKKILIVENRFIIAEEIVDLVLLLKCEPVGPVATLAEALSTIGTFGSMIDAAILDIDLDGELVYAAAEMLEVAGTPFVFATGYNNAAIPGRWSQVPRLEKPYGATSLRDTLGALLDGWRPPGPAGEGPRSANRQRVADPRFENARKLRERRMEDAVLHKWRNLSGD